MKKKLNIKFINPNTEEQIIQAMSGVLAYNLAEYDEKIVFNYKDVKADYIEDDDELEM